MTCNRPVEPGKQKTPSTGPAEICPYQVCGDPEQIGGKPFALVIPDHGLVKPHKGLLRILLGVIPVPAKMGEIVEERALVPIDNNGEYFAVSGLHASHRLGVAQILHSP